MDSPAGAELDVDGAGALLDDGGALVVEGGALDDGGALVVEGGALVVGGALLEEAGALDDAGALLVVAADEDGTQLTTHFLVETGEFVNFLPAQPTVTLSPPARLTDEVTATATDAADTTTAATAATVRVRRHRKGVTCFGPAARNCFRIMGELLGEHSTGGDKAPGLRAQGLRQGRVHPGPYERTDPVAHEE